MYLYHSNCFTQSFVLNSVYVHYKIAYINFHFHKGDIETLVS